MSKVSNVITLLELLQSGRKYSIKELSTILEVSERMIRVYKEDLEKAGIYIDSILGPYGGYVLTRPVKIPIRRFSESDYKLLDQYIEKEPDEVKRESLLTLQNKIKGIYIGSKQDTSKFKLEGELQKKFNLLKSLYIIQLFLRDRSYGLSLFIYIIIRQPFSRPYRSESGI